MGKTSIGTRLGKLQPFAAPLVNPRKTDMKLRYVSTKFFSLCFIFYFSL